MPEIKKSMLSVDGNTAAALESYNFIEDLYYKEQFWKALEAYYH